MVSAGDFKNGLTVEIEGDVFQKKITSTAFKKTIGTL